MFLKCKLVLHRCLYYISAHYYYCVNMHVSVLNFNTAHTIISKENLETIMITVNHLVGGV